MVSRAYLIAVRRTFRVDHANADAILAVIEIFAVVRLPTQIKKKMGFSRDRRDAFEAA